MRPVTRCGAAVYLTELWSQSKRLCWPVRTLVVSSIVPKTVSTGTCTLPLLHEQHCLLARENLLEG